MKYKAVIFDLDGVICQTDELHYLAWKALADRLNIYFDHEINNRMRGMSRMACVDIILERADREYSALEKEAFAAEKNAIYADSLRKVGEKDVSDDVRETLKELKAKGVSLGIASSSKNAPEILERIGLEDTFDAIADGHDLIPADDSPEPGLKAADRLEELFLKAAEKLGLQPGECLVAEDAVSGIDAGIAGGFVTAGIGPAASYEKTDYKLNKLSELLAL